MDPTADICVHLCLPHPGLDDHLHRMLEAVVYAQHRKVRLSFFAGPGNGRSQPGTAAVLKGLYLPVWMRYLVDYHCNEKRPYCSMLSVCRALYYGLHADGHSNEAEHLLSHSQRIYGDGWEAVQKVLFSKEVKRPCWSPEVLIGEPLLFLEGVFCFAFAQNCEKRLMDFLAPVITSELRAWADTFWSNLNERLPFASAPSTRAETLDYFKLRYWHNLDLLSQAAEWDLEEENDEYSEQEEEADLDGSLGMM